MATEVIVTEQAAREVISLRGQVPDSGTTERKLESTWQKKIEEMVDNQTTILEPIHEKLEDKTEDIKIGDRVQITGSNDTGVVTSGPDSQGYIQYHPDGFSEGSSLWAFKGSSKKIS